MKRLVYFFLTLFFVSACRDAAPDIQLATIDAQEYELSAIPGTSAQEAIRRDEMGAVVERGFVDGGVRQGSWSQYTGDGELPEKIFNYVDGALNGPYLESDSRGRITKIAHYRANQLHGSYAEYRQSLPVKTATYFEGKLHGTVTDYDYTTNRVKQETSYRMGELHGPLRYFNEEGEIMLEYEYENGEKIAQTQPADG